MNPILERSSTRFTDSYRETGLVKSHGVSVTVIVLETDSHRKFGPIRSEGNVPHLQGPNWWEFFFRLSINMLSQVLA